MHHSVADTSMLNKLRSIFRRRGDGGQRYAILLHARNLLLTDADGVERLGGAYTWCDVNGADESDAIERATKELFETEVFVREVRNQNRDDIRIDAEEVLRLGCFASDKTTGIVFYVPDGT